MTTIQDVAKQAGVSVATVSRVINRTGNVSPKTKKAVETAIEQLHYVPNMLGWNLRKNETKKILVLLDTISNQFYSRVTAGIEERAAFDGYIVMLGCTRGSPDTEDRYLEMLRTRLVDGIILLSGLNQADELTKKLAGQPAVLACETVEGSKLPFIGIDNEKAALDAVNYLIGCGFRKIAFFGAGEGFSSSKLRLIGYRKALEQNHIPCDPSLIYQDGFSYRSGMRCAEQMLSDHPNDLPQAIFTLSDSCAVGAIKALHEHHLKVPEDISVMGFDNTRNARLFIPELTTVAQPQYEIGYHAADSLIRIIKGEAAEDIPLPHEIIKRHSVSNRDTEYKLQYGSPDTSGSEGKL